MREDGGSGNRPVRRRAVGLVMVASVLLAGAGVMVGRSTSEAAPVATSATADLRTEEVALRTLSRTTDVDGMLGYGESEALALNLPGMLTWLPKVGSLIDRGATIARVNDRPVVALLGSIPLYRPLTIGVRGRDVLQLKENLASLGYGTTDTSATYTRATASVVRAWQADRGLARTGEVTTSWVTILRHPVRIADRTAQPGMAATGEILQTTGTDRVVTASLGVAKRDLAVVGRPVTIELPGGATASGKIASVGSPQIPDSEPGQEVDLEQATIPVTIRVTSPAAFPGLDIAPVAVRFIAEVQQGVLAVPVDALLALASGGYGVEILDGAATRTVPVTTGMFADGVVEVSVADGGSLKAGDRVVVPS
jgi:peptidoglycan hydrolase-like protein with peptidoglycan-binding domain